MNKHDMVYEAHTRLQQGVPTRPGDQRVVGTAAATGAVCYALGTCEGLPFLPRPMSPDHPPLPYTEGALLCTKPCLTLCVYSKCVKL